jgi:hypothetical protein
VVLPGGFVPRVLATLSSKPLAGREVAIATRLIASIAIAEA